MKASDLLVRCLENEGVEFLFGLPGEETLDVMDSLLNSRIRFIETRHEQGAAFMADVYGRLSGKAGVCLSTLGPGATNLLTGVADANLDRAPLVAITGQVSLDRMHKESHQYIDLVSIFKPVTKWNAEITRPHIIPEAVRKAFKVAQTEKPGATHLELPEDVAAEQVSERETDGPLRVQAPFTPEPLAAQVKRAVHSIAAAKRPVMLAGNGVIRGRAHEAVRRFARALNIPVAHTFMGKGIMSDDDPLSLYALGLQMRDYPATVFEQADVTRIGTSTWSMWTCRRPRWTPITPSRSACSAILRWRWSKSGTVSPRSTSNGPSGAVRRSWPGWRPSWPARPPGRCARSM